jgi:hypothetical protein
MKTWLKIAVLLVLALGGAIGASAQGSLYAGIAWRYTPAGAFPAGGATITVCTSGGSGTPCTPIVSLFSNSALTQPVANPLPNCTTNPQVGCIDNFGNFTFYATPGAYTFTATGAGLTPYGPIPIGLPCVASISCVSTSNPNTFTAPQAFSAAMNANAGGTLAGTFGGALALSGSQTVGKWNGWCVVDGVLNATLAAAVACAGSNGAILVPPLTIATLTANVSIPAGVTLWFATGGSSGQPGSIALGNFNLTINGRLQAPVQQIFIYSGTGKVILGQDIAPAVYPEWWGAVGDGATNDQAAIQNAWNASFTGSTAFLPLYFGCKTYLVTSNLNFTGISNFHLAGCARASEGGSPSPHVTIVQANFTGANTVGVDFSGGNFGHVHDINFNCGTSTANAPTVCVLQARTSGANGLDDQYERVDFTGYSPWVYYNVHGEQASFVDCSWNELSTTVGVPLTFSGPNTAGITSPNVTLGGFNSSTVFSITGATSTVNSFTTTASQPLLYLDEGAGSVVSGVFLGPGFFINMQGSNQIGIGDTSGATGTITAIQGTFYTNSSSTTNIAVKINGIADNWHLIGHVVPPASETVTQFQFNQLLGSQLQAKTNQSSGNCVTANLARGSIIQLDTNQCPISAPAALLTSGLTSSMGMAEGTCPSTALNTDIFCADSTTQRENISNHNGFFSPVGQLVVKGTSTFATTAIAAAACGATASSTVTFGNLANIASGDVISWSYQTQPTAATDGALTVEPWTVAATSVNFQRCNTTAGSITPTAIVINWVVIH